MEAKNKNACPICGGELRTRCHFGSHSQKWDVTVACESGHAVTLKLDLSGNTPTPRVSAAAKAAFAHPAHLMASLYTYDPATEVKVSRETARCALINIPDSAEGGVSPREHAARAELRAALEVKE